MNRRELVKNVVGKLRENGIKKPISAQRQVLHISDDSGNSTNFVVKKSDRSILFTYEDIESILDTFITVIEDALKEGDQISIRGFGTLGLHYRKARRTKHPDTGEPVEVPDRYVPKFAFGNDLRMCARLFELALEDKSNNYRIENNIISDNELNGGDGDGD